MVALRFILALLFFSFPALAENYFVNSSTGNDTNSGLTSILAWKTLTNAFAKVGAGDTVYSTGSWTHYVQAICSADNVTWNGQGSSTITVVPVSTTGTIGFSGDGCIFKNFTILSTATPTGTVQTLLRFTGDNSRIEDCVIRDIGPQSVEDEIVFELSASFCTVSNLYFYNIADWDLFRTWGIYNKFTSCVFSNITNPNAGIGGDPHADNFQTWWIGVPVWSNIIERCYFVDSDAACFQLKGSPDNTNCNAGAEGYWTLRNNIFNNCLSYPHWGTDKTRFYNNLMYYCGPEFIHKAAYCQDYGRYYNNVLVETGFRFDGNILSGLGDNADYGYNSFTDGSLNWGGIGDVTVPEEDCKFVDAAGGNFRPQQGSVLIGSGLNLTTDASMTVYDWDGNVRKPGGYWTRGPFEGNTDPQSFPNTYCVRAGATGANTGSNWTDAFPALPSSLNRGATYYLADGDYGEYDFDDEADAPNMIFIKKATPLYHGQTNGWLDAYGDGQATFTGTRLAVWRMGNTISGNGGYYDINGYSELATNNRGIRVIADGPWPDNVQCVSAEYGAGNFPQCKFRYIEFVGEMNDGVHRWYNSPSPYGFVLFPYSLHGYDSSDGLVVSHCSFNGCGTCYSDSSGDSNLLIEYCEMWNNWNEATPDDHANVILLKGSGATIRYNHAWDYNAEGIYTLGSINGLNVYGNVFEGGGDLPKGVVLSYTASHNNVKIYNNTFINMHEGVRVMDTAVTTSCEIKNNLMVGSGVSIENSGGTTASDNFTTNTAIFVNYASANFHLNTATPDGEHFGAPFNQDPDGVIRGNDGIWDIGAYEFFGAYVDTTPPIITRAEIGASGTNITVTFSEVTHTNAGGTGGWDLGMTAGPVTFTYLSGNNSASWIYDLSRKVSGYETVTNGLDYTTPGAGTGISDAATNFLVNTSSVPVINSSQDAKAETPVADLADGYYYGTQTITLTCDTPSPTIYYTTDGSTPDTGDTEYTVPIELSSVTILKAIATAAGYTNSNVSSNFYQINAWMSDPNNFISVALPTNSGAFSFSFDVYPTNVPLDLVVGFSKYPVTAYTNMSCILRFNSGSTRIDAYNNDDYYYALELGYGPNVHYRFSGTIDTAAFTYSASVSTNLTTPLLFAPDYVFREESATSDELGYLGIRGTLYPTIVSNLVWGTSVPVGPILNVEVLNVGP